MENCLVLKCGGVVNNDSLLKVGELRIEQNKIDSPTSLTQAIIVEGDNIDAEIIGDGYFTDKALTANLGKSISNVKSPLYVSNSNCIISIKNKYNITALSFRERSVAQWVNTATHVNNKKVDIEGLKYSYNIIGLTVITDSDISYLSNLTKISTLILDKNSVTGDIANLANMTNMRHLSLDNSVTGDIANLANMTNMRHLSLDNSVTGDIANLANMTNMEYLSLGNSVTGDIANLANMTNMNQLYLSSNVNITGDISSLANMNKLSNIILPSRIKGDISILKNCSKLSEFTTFSSSISGDLAVMPKEIGVIYFINGGSFTWSTRDSTASIISIKGNIGIDNIDKMLQDQANCVALPSVSEKVIVVKGTRTSASDGAVQILQNKGYTITINPA